MKDRFDSDLKRVLAADTDSVDDATRLELARRRTAALAAGLKPARLTLQWVPLAAVAAAVIAAVIWWPRDTTLPVVAGTDDDIDLEILLAEDNLELYEDLEFYEWLGTSRDAG